MDTPTMTGQDAPTGPVVSEPPTGPMVLVGPETAMNRRQRTIAWALTLGAFCASLSPHLLDTHPLTTRPLVGALVGALGAGAATLAGTLMRLHDGAGE